jgi:ethanolaminephosphotransferase
MLRLGQLYLGVFSGPVEGILMVIVVFIITGFCGASITPDYVSTIESRAGPTFWDHKILTITRLENVDWIASHVPNVALNVCLMIFSTFVLGFNIVTRYLFIFQASVAAHVWLATPTY